MLVNPFTRQVINESHDRTEAAGNDGEIKEENDDSLKMSKAEKVKDLVKKIEKSKAAKAAAGQSDEYIGNEQPSDTLAISPEKACTIIKDGQVHGHPLTQAQRGMFGALCGKRG